MSVWMFVQSKEERQICQMQYLAWPDHGVPDDSSDFLNFVSQVRSKRADTPEPVVVHCRSGPENVLTLSQQNTMICLLTPPLLFQCRDWSYRGTYHHGDSDVFDRKWSVGVSLRHRQNHERPACHDDPDSCE